MRAVSRDENSVRPATAEVDLLVEELAHVRQRGVFQLFEGDQQIRRLLAIAKRLYPLGATKAAPLLLQRLLNAAIHSEGMAAYSSAEGEALLIFFGASRIPNTDKLREGKREKEAAKTAGATYGTYRKKAARDRRLKDVARSIMDLRVSFDPIPAETELTDRGIYITRHAAERRFRELLNSGAPVIAFAGPASVGKRTLAKHLTNQLKPAGSTVLHINSVSSEVQQQSICDELLRLGMPAKDINYAAPRYSLLELLQTPAAPRYVLITDAQDNELAGFLVARSTNTTVVLTTTQRLRRRDDDSHNASLTDEEILS